MVMSAATAAATTTFTMHFNVDPPPGFAPDAIPVTCSPAGNAIENNATGNGVFHVTINNAGDEWITGTFEGQGTVTVGNLSNPNDPSTFTPTPGGPIYTGHIQEWFGGEFNQNNFVNHATYNFDGTDQSGNSVAIHAQLEFTVNANHMVKVNNLAVNCR
jgi:hypothetical protein